MNTNMPGFRFVFKNLCILVLWTICSLSIESVKVQPTYWKIVYFKIRRIRLLNLTSSIAGLSEKLIRIADIVLFYCYCEFLKCIETFMESETLSEYEKKAAIHASYEICT